MKVAEVIDEPKSGKEQEVVFIPQKVADRLILRHSNLSTTQRYLGKVSEPEALRWIESLYG